MKIKKEGKEEVHMQFIITKDYDELSQVISSTMLKHMHTDKPRVNICVTTGTTRHTLNMSITMWWMSSGMRKMREHRMRISR